MAGDWYEPYAECEDTFCEYGQHAFPTYRAARTAAHKHHKATGHTTRCEQFRTHLFITPTAPTQAEGEVRE